MMFFLMVDVLDNVRNLGTTAVSTLPFKFALAKSIGLNPFAATFFYFPDQIREALGWFVSDEEMDMVRHAIDGQHFVAALSDRARNIFVE